MAIHRAFDQTMNPPKGEGLFRLGVGFPRLPVAAGTRSAVKSIPTNPARTGLSYRAFSAHSSE